MEIINNSINNQLILLLEKTSKDIFNSINVDKTKIGYYNIYHNKWSQEKNNKYIDLIDKIITEIYQNESNFIIKDKILYAGFIYSFPDCDTQMFHFDYANKSETYFIPLLDLTDQNGTEFLAFNNTIDYKNNFEILNNINNKYLSKDDVKKYLFENNINETEYIFKIHNTNAYSLYKLPKNVLHRGKKNETDKLRVLFQLVTIEDTKYIENILSDEIILNAQLDDNYSIKDLNKFYLLKFNNKFLKLSKRGKNYNYSEIEYCDNYEYSTINNFKWYIIIKNNLLYIYHKNGVLLTIINNDSIEPFHFNINFDDKYFWKLMSNNQLCFTENIIVSLIEID